MEGQGAAQIVAVLGDQQGDLGGCGTQCFAAPGVRGEPVQQAAQVFVSDDDAGDAVVGEESLVDRFSQGDAVDDGPVDAHVVHGGDDGVGADAFGAGLLLVEDAGRRGHVEAVAGGHLVVVVDAGPGFVVVTGGAVGFVGDHDVPAGQVEVAVGFDDLVQGVVGAEHVERSLGVGGLLGQVVGGVDHGEDAGQVRVRRLA